MKINRKKLDLITIYTNFSHAETIQNMEDLIRVKENLEDVIIDLKEISMYDEDIVNEIATIKEQISYLNQNIRTLEDAILCHESKMFQKMTANNKFAKVCLN
jgi:hypothetical protein